VNTVGTTAGGVVTEGVGGYALMPKYLNSSGVQGIDGTFEFLAVLECAIDRASGAPGWVISGET